MKPTFLALLFLSFQLLTSLARAQEVEYIQFPGQEPIPLNMGEVKMAIGYPLEAKNAKIEGKVVLQVQVDTLGNYRGHKVLKAGHPILLSAVEREIHRLRFTPGMADGKPVHVLVTIPFDFVLGKGAGAARTEISKAERIQAVTASVDSGKVFCHIQDGQHAGKCMDTVAAEPRDMEGLIMALEKELMPAFPDEEIELRVDVIISEMGACQRLSVEQVPGSKVGNAVSAVLLSQRWKPASLCGDAVESLLVLQVRLKKR